MATSRFNHAGSMEMWSIIVRSASHKLCELRNDIASGLCGFATARVNLRKICGDVFGKPWTAEMRYYTSVYYAVLVKDVRPKVSFELYVTKDVSEVADQNRMTSDELLSSYEALPPTQERKEEAMCEVTAKQDVPFETISYVYGKDVRLLTQDDILKALDTINSEREKLAKLKRMPKSMKARLDELEEATTKIIEAVDARDDE